MFITILIPTKVEVTNAEFELIRRGYKSVDRVRWIKFIKEQYNLPLAQAKAVCEAIVAVPDWTVPS